MSRPTYPLRIADLSAFARSLREQLSRLDHAPGHVEMLNLLCRSAGFRNYQHFRAEAETGVPAPVVPEPPPPDLARVEKAARHFDGQGRMTRWPARASLAHLCLWVLWSRIPPREVFTERQISDLLKRWHTFGDHALLRRALFDARLVERTRDGREYLRMEQKPPPELGPLLARIGALAAGPRIDAG